MSKKRREKTKAKQRRHIDNLPPKKEAAPVSNQQVASQAPKSVTPKPTKPTIVQPLKLENKQLIHVAPNWKEFYTAVSRSLP